MPISLNKSSLLAAMEIINDKNFLKYKNLNYLESYKTTLDVKSGRNYWYCWNRTARKFY